MTTSQQASEPACQQRLIPNAGGPRGQGALIRDSMQPAVLEVSAGCPLNAHQAAITIASTNAARRR